MIVPLLYLITHDQIGVWGFLSDRIHQLFASAVCLAVFLSVLDDARKDRSFCSLRRRIGQLLGAALIFLMAVLLFFLFVRNVGFHVRLHRLAGVESVQVGCREITDPKDVERITEAVRNARWFWPTGHGWRKDIPFTLKLRSGQELRYFLNRSLWKQSAVIVSPAANPNRAASAELATILTQTGAWHATPKWSDNTHSYRNEMTVSSEGACQPAQRH